MVANTAKTAAGAAELLAQTSLLNARILSGRTKMFYVVQKLYNKKICKSSKIFKLVAQYAVNTIIFLRKINKGSNAVDNIIIK